MATADVPRRHANRKMNNPMDTSVRHEVSVIYETYCPFRNMDSLVSLFYGLSRFRAIHIIYAACIKRTALDILQFLRYIIYILYRVTAVMKFLLLLRCASVTTEFISSYRIIFFFYKTLFFITLHYLYDNCKFIHARTCYTQNSISFSVLIYISCSLFVCSDYVCCLIYREIESSARDAESSPVLIFRAAELMNDIVSRSEMCSCSNVGYYSILCSTIIAQGIQPKMRYIDGNPFEWDLLEILYMPGRRDQFAIYKPDRCASDSAPIIWMSIKYTIDISRHIYSLCVPSRKTLYTTITARGARRKYLINDIIWINVFRHISLSQ